MDIPIPVAVALLGVLILGGVVTAGIAVVGGLATLISLWNSIRPKTESFVEKETLHEIEVRLSKQISDVSQMSNQRAGENRGLIIENRENTDSRFDNFGKEIKELSGTIRDLREQVVDLMARLDLKARPVRKARAL